MPLIYICKECGYKIAETYEVYPIEFIRAIHTEVDFCAKKYKPKVFTDEDIKLNFYCTDVNSRTKYDIANYIKKTSVENIKNS